MLLNIKSKVVFKQIFSFVEKNKYLKLIKNNKKAQQKLNISLDSYMQYYKQIEIEIIPKQSDDLKDTIFINTSNFNDNIIYFNSDSERISRNKFQEYDDISKIRVLIDIKNGNSLKALFATCSKIQEIKFIHCALNILTDISYLFMGCKSLVNVDLSRLKLDNIEDTSYMFANCISLKTIKFPKSTINIFTNMEYMFYGCSSLENIDISNFKTDQVQNMHGLFSGCKLLKELKLSNLKTESVVNIDKYVWNV